MAVTQFNSLDRSIVENLRFKKSKMAGATKVKKSKNNHNYLDRSSSDFDESRHISVAVSPISTKFRMVTQFDPHVDRSYSYRFEI